MTIKLLNCNYDVETGVSTATVICRLGTFTGTSKLLPEDNDISSRYRGVEYAHIKAIIKAHKALLKDKKRELKAIEDLYKVVISLKETYIHSPECRRIRRRIYEMQEEILLLSNYISQEKTNLLNYMEKNDKKVRKLLGE